MRVQCRDIDLAVLRAIRKHAATVTRHKIDCRCRSCAEVRVRGKRYARVQGWLPL